ncbi:unnamed protein product, partial [Musa acuminata subsp. burmannicoides]
MHHLQVHLLRVLFLGRPRASGGFSSPSASWLPPKTLIPIMIGTPLIITDVTASTRKIANSQIPAYTDLPSQFMCQVHNVTLHADKETDEIYAQMTLQPET